MLFASPFMSRSFLGTWWPGKISRPEKQRSELCLRLCPSEVENRGKMPGGDEGCEGAELRLSKGEIGPMNWENPGGRWAT